MRLRARTEASCRGPIRGVAKVQTNSRWRRAIRRLRSILASENLEPDVEREAHRVLRDAERAMALGDSRAIRTAAARLAAFFLRNPR